MRNVLRLMGLAGIVLAFSPACSTKQSGQIMLAVQTDMSLPKDIDRVRIEVTRADSGAIIYQNDFERLGTEKSIRLPATLGVTAPEDETVAIKLRVIATHGSDEEETVRVLREIVTKIPTDRVATLPVSLEFLCNGSGEAERDQNNKIKRDSSGVVIVKNSCPDERTCVAGLCVVNEVPPESLPVYVKEQVFGGGTGSGDGRCFDTSTCFNDSTEVALDLDAFRASKETVCEVAATGDVNIALRTQGGGICGRTGCFVALDEGGPSGWKPGSAGKIALPAGVCAKAIAGEVVGLVTAPVDGARCQKKQISLPTCGPWSATDPSASVPDSKEPTLVAPGQIRPAALAIADKQIVWTNRGTFDENGDTNGDGTVKIVPIEGGQPLTISSSSAKVSPQGIAVDSDRRFILWTNAGKVNSGNQEITWASYAYPGVIPVSHQLLEVGVRPEGIAMSGSTVYWTDSQSSKVFQIGTKLSGEDLGASSSTPDELASPSPSSTSPFGIAAVGKAVCWTYQDKLGSGEGVVACSLDGKPVTVATQQHTPRSIAMSPDGTTVYWANFDALPGGGIWEATITGTSVSAPVLVAPEDNPAGLAVDADGETLFWTSRSLGFVNMAKKTMKGYVVSPLNEKKQLHPGSIAVTADTVFWINEGTDNPPKGAAPDGAIMKVAR
jgi:sugar lactone lactonase YvrE